MNQDFPLRGYLYDRDGLHRGGEWLEDEAALRQFMVEAEAAMREGREVRVTDALDQLVFHAEHGRIAWPPPP